MKKLVSMLLTTVTSIMALVSCSKEEVKPIQKSQTYVLVHGAWQAPYVWESVKSDLIKNGHKVIVVELPGHGKDKSLNHTLSLDVYRDKVIQSIENVNEKVILVGHSMAGMVISAVAEKVPLKISKLVYVGAFLPKNGESLVNLAFSDSSSLLGQNLIESEDKLTIDVNRENLIKLFIHDGNQAAKDSVLMNYRAEPSIPLTNPVVLTANNFGKVNKVYIKTLLDVVISPALQDKMIAGAGIETVWSLNSSHSPFLSMPEKMTELLLKTAE